uniref:Serine/threonine-protein kinase 1 n=1 Tax=Periophthalmus magnuspinnatus TaxID=409849 RepID=A0A3B4AXW3_9GOBI
MPRQADRAQQRHLLAQLAHAGGLEDFNACYEQDHKPGSGGFGSVYKGVAIKHVPKNKVDYISMASCGMLYNLPKEVYLMLRAADGADRTLHDPLPEHTFRDIMRQLVLALKDLYHKRVFHRDLKTNNIMIQEAEEGIRVRIINFRCDCTVSAMSYTSYTGTLNYSPPELFLDGRYRDGPTSVWQLRVITYELLNGDGSDFATSECVIEELSMKTSEGKDFIQGCLEKDPSERMSWSWKDTSGFSARLHRHHTHLLIPLQKT